MVKAGAYRAKKKPGQKKTSTKLSLLSMIISLIKMSTRLPGNSVFLALLFAIGFLAFTNQLAMHMELNRSYQRGQRRLAPGTGNVPTSLSAGSSSLPSPASAHAHFADSAPNVVAPNYGPYHSYIPYRPLQYIRYSSEFINNNTTSTAHTMPVHRLTHYIPPHNF